MSARIGKKSAMPIGALLVHIYFIVYLKDEKEVSERRSNARKQSIPAGKKIFTVVFNCGEL